MGSIKAKAKELSKTKEDKGKRKKARKASGNEDDVEAFVSDTYTSPEAQAKVILEKVIAPEKKRKAVPDLNDSDTIYSSSGSSDVEAVVVHSDTSFEAQAEVIPRKVIAHAKGQTKTKE